MKRPARPAADSCCGTTRATPLPAEWRDRAVLVVATPDPAVDLRHYRAIAPFMRERWRGPVRHRRAGRDARWPVVAAAAHVPLALPRGRCDRNDRARGACVRHSARHRRADRRLLQAPTASTCSSATTIGQARPRWRVALGADHRSAAAIGHAGRRLVEERHDLSVAAAAVVSCARLAAHLRRGCSRTSPISRPLPCLDRSREPKPASES